MKLLTLSEIKAVLPSLDLMSVIEAGFVAYSEGRAVVPPVGELLFDEPPGDVHIKYGYLAGDDYYVIKIASGFYQNPDMGLPSSNGLMLLFSQKTGVCEAVLHDEGHLTDVRTAVAGAIAAKYLAPPKIQRIGIVGTGIQARLQLAFLKPLVKCRDVLVWGRSGEKIADYAGAMSDFAVEGCVDAREITERCQLIVTTTPATEPILTGELQKGTHITAVGADTPHKRELGISLLQQADVVVADAISQCVERGEIHHAITAGVTGVIERKDLVELGEVIGGKQAGRESADQITIADLTGVAVQDIEIAKAVFKAVSLS